jgi:hypothetical protein
VAHPGGGRDGRAADGGRCLRPHPSGRELGRTLPGPGRRCVALMLRERGVRVRFLRADTPVPALPTGAPPAPPRSCSRALPADPVRAVVVLGGAGRDQRQLVKRLPDTGA